MIGDLLNSSLYAWIGTLSLLMFFCVFVAITIRTLLTDKKITMSEAEIPLDDGERSPR
ncbi:hypothetical protein AB1L30_25380 [Bremerella sp. JC817]|uniref:hypothetical protein n=1 Tax=Bremerella sp. JC817 TaxID=3231756 RepID=UPI0034578CA1